MKKIKVGSQFSGVGAFEQALTRLKIDHDNIYAADLDKYARITYLANYEEPKYYVKDVYDTPIEEINKNNGSLDLVMFSPPCQAFSLAGKRKGKEDLRGILFFNSHEFIAKNKPRFFIFENVKGLLSDDNGNTFQEWINYLGGKSVNGVPVLFPTDEAIPYHIYWKVLNAKDYNIPQNRERVFIVGIRDDSDNVFSWPIEQHLTKRLKDVLETDVEEKYFLSEKLLSGIIRYNKTIGEIANINKGRQSGQVFAENSQYITTLSACDYKMPKSVEIGTWRTHKDGQGFREMEDELCPTIPARAREDGSGQPVIKVKSATKSGYETATENDSINFSVPNSETRRGRVGKGVAQTLDTSCNQGVIKGYRIRRLTPRECFRLMDFPDTFVYPVSDSQAYKQAGNSICVGVLVGIINGLKKL